jgi:hypothetical protein
MGHKLKSINDIISLGVYTVKKRLAIVPSPDEMSLGKLSQDGNN